MYMRSEQTEPDRDAVWGCVSTSDRETTWYFPAAFPKTSWMFLKRRNQTSLARLLDVLLPTEPDVSARHQDVFSCFCGDKTGSIFIRTYTFLAAFLTSTIYFFNKTSGHFERRRGNWTGHFQLDLWRQNWAFFKRLLLCLLWQKMIFLSPRRNIFWSYLWRQNQVF